MQAGDLRVDTATRQAFLGDKELHLSSQEFDVLVALMERQGQTVPRQWLLENVVGGEDLRRVDHLIKWLRDKIETDEWRPIKIVRGIGYRFDG